LYVTRGGVDWHGGAGGCNSLTGWFVVDAIAYAGGRIAAIDLRVEQHCNGDAPSLHGQVHWTATDPAAGPSPVVPPPAALWRAPPGATPPSGSYVYLESEPGDFVGAGGTYLYTKADALLDVAAAGALLTVGVQGDEQWSGDFQGFEGLTELRPGYYAGLGRYPFYEPV